MHRKVLMHHKEYGRTKYSSRKKSTVNYWDGGIMSNIKGAFVFPHPPIAVAEVGKGEASKTQKTIDGAEEAARRIAAIKPDTIVIITPHGNMLADAVVISGDHRLEGSFGSFGVPQVRIELENDTALVDEILDIAEEEGLMAIALEPDIRKTYRFEDELDHGALVPLYFITKQYSNFKLVHITYSMLPHEDNYRFGMAVRKAIEGNDRRVVVIGSGDLSHRLTRSAPAGYSPKGAEFDAAYVDIIKEGDISRLMNMDCELTESAGECGLRSTVMLFGILENCSPKGEILSYEGPFGVGYCVAELRLDCKEDYEGESPILNRYIGEKKKRLEEIKGGEDAYTSLARKTLESYIRSGKVPIMDENLPKDMTEDKAGVFVSIKKNGELRGCIGTIAPTTSSIAAEIMQNAVSAGTGDPRFYTVDEDELDELQYSVDVLMKPESIDTPEQLDVKRYGVIVRSGYRSGLLLPNLEGVDTVEEQLDIALQKAGISKGEKYKMERFEVIRHK